MEKKYYCSFAESGADLGDYEGKEKLFDFLNSNKAIYNEADFETEEGNIELQVENSDNLDYIGNISVVWYKD